MTSECSLKEVLDSRPTQVKLVTSAVKVSINSPQAVPLHSFTMTTHPSPWNSFVSCASADLSSPVTAETVRYCLPSAYAIGVAKAGTTALYTYAKQHPSISDRIRKGLSPKPHSAEPNGFLERSEPLKELQAFAAALKGRQDVFGLDVSPLYFMKQPTLPADLYGLTVAHSSRISTRGAHHSASA